MKTSQQIIGLPVISISDGIEIGNVKNAIVNASRGTVDYLVVDSGPRALPGGVVPVESVLGIGEDAVTVMNPDDVLDIAKTPAAVDLIQKNVLVSGIRVMTRKGTMMGETGDFFVDEDAGCVISGIFFKPARNGLPSGIIHRESIITFGKNLLVVRDDFLSMLLQEMDESMAPITPTTSVQQAENLEQPVVQAPDVSDLDAFLSTRDSVAVQSASPSSASFPAEYAADADPFVNAAAVTDVMEPMIPDYGALEEPVSLTESTEPTLESTPDLFSERQKQFLRGRRVTRSITDAQGRMIVRAGDVITDEIIELARNSEVLVDLVMNNE